MIEQIRLERERVRSWDRYPFSIPALQELDTLPLGRSVTYFVGENGSGKSTLLEALAVRLGLNAEGGTQHFRFSTRESHSELHEYLDLGRRFDPSNPPDGFFLRAESFFNVATEIERMDTEDRGEYGHLLSQSWTRAFGGKSLHEQSHGEAFLSLFQSRFGIGSVFLLDEPEAALSPVRQMALLSILHSAARGGAQFVIATHAPIVLAYPGAMIYQFTPSGIEKVEYEETEVYRVTHDFLENRERMLHHLLED